MASRSSRAIPHAVLASILAIVAADAHHTVEYDLEPYIPILAALSVGGVAAEGVKRIRRRPAAVPAKVTYDSPDVYVPTTDGPVERYTVNTRSIPDTFTVREPADNVTPPDIRRTPTEDITRNIKSRWNAPELNKPLPGNRYTTSLRRDGADDGLYAVRGEDDILTVAVEGARSYITLAVNPGRERSMDIKTSFQSPPPSVSVLIASLPPGEYTAWGNADAGTGDAYKFKFTFTIRQAR